MGICNQRAFAELHIVLIAARSGADQAQELSGLNIADVGEMARDSRKLEVFHLSDALAVEVYRHTCTFPDSERYGLAAQMRRAAISAPANLVEGTERTTQKDFLRHIDIAAGSAAEVRYLLLSPSRRLGLGEERTAQELEGRYDALVRALQGLRAALRRLPDRRERG